MNRFALEQKKKRIINQTKPHAISAYSFFSMTNSTFLKVTTDFWSAASPRLGRQFPKLPPDKTIRAGLCDTCPAGRESQLWHQG